MAVENAVALAKVSPKARVAAARRLLRWYGARVSARRHRWANHGACEEQRADEYCCPVA